MQSVSRLVGEIVTPEVREAGTRLRSALAAYREKEDLISIGAYQPGTDPGAGRRDRLRPAIDAFLRQRVDEPSTAEDADAHLLALAARARAPRVRSPARSIDGRPLPGGRAFLGGRSLRGGVSGPPAIPSLQLTA